MKTQPNTPGGYRKRKKNKLVCGVGINDADYAISKELVWYEDGVRKRKLVWRCPYYDRWTAMMKRCYSNWYQKENKTYSECIVCEEWLIFSNFKAWMETQDWEGKHLDKDILFEGNKLYSPETCVFVSRKLNTFILDSANNDLKGTKTKYGKFEVSIGSKYIGTVETQEEAHRKWKEAKLKALVELLEDVSDQRIIDALKGRYQ